MEESTLYLIGIVLTVLSFATLLFGGYFLFYKSPEKKEEPKIKVQKREHQFGKPVHAGK